MALEVQESLPADVADLVDDEAVKPVAALEKAARYCGPPR
jgi:hypothetical protein